MLTFNFDSKINSHNYYLNNEGKWANLAISAFLATNMGMTANAKQQSPTTVAGTKAPVAMSNAIKPGIERFKSIISSTITSLRDPTSVVTSNFVNKIVTMESKYNPKARGDFQGSDSKARGMMQLHAGAWNDTIKNTKNPFLKKLSYNKDAYNANANLRIGIEYLRQLEKRIKANGVEKPTEEQVYAAWNAGLSNLAKYKFDINQLIQHNPQFNKNLTKFKSL